MNLGNVVITFAFKRLFYKTFNFSILSFKVVGVSEAYEDAANCLWLLTNSKPCANCKSPIQKNEGCNHMQCAKVTTVKKILQLL